MAATVDWDGRATCFLAFLNTLTPVTKVIIQILIHFGYANKVG